jgi:hypothetical protein
MRFAPLSYHPILAKAGSFSGTALKPLIILGTMTDKIIVTDAIRDLISEMVRMLIVYEMELTAHYLVTKHAQEKIIQLGVPWDMESNVRKILRSPVLHTEAEAEYAPFAALLQQLTPLNFEIALAAIRRKIADHDAKVSPEDSE